MPSRPNVPYHLKAQFKRQKIVAWRIKRAKEKRENDKKYVADLRARIDELQRRLIKEKSEKLAAAVGKQAVAHEVDQDAELVEVCAV